MVSLVDAMFVLFAAKVTIRLKLNYQLLFWAEINIYLLKMIRKVLPAILIALAGFCRAQTQISQLPILNQISRLSDKTDWLVRTTIEPAGVYKTDDGKEIILYNGLIKRSFRIQPNVACVDFVNLASGEQMLRAVEPEARLTINGKPVNVGGLYGQKQKAYLLKEWVDDLKAHEQDFQFKGFTVSSTIRPRAAMILPETRPCYARPAAAVTAQRLASLRHKLKRSTKCGTAKRPTAVPLRPRSRTAIRTHYKRINCGLDFRAAAVWTPSPRHRRTAWAWPTV